MKNCKIICLLIFLGLLGLNGYTQEPPENELKKQVSFSSGIYNSTIFRFEEIEGTGHYSDGTATEFGIDMSLPLDSKLWMGFGLYYLKSKNKYHSAIIGSEQGYTLKHQTEIIHLPVQWQYNLTDWFGLKVGLSIGIEFKDENSLNQNGLGFLGGAVIHYSPLPWLDAGIEPSLHLTSMLPIPQEFHQQHFFLSGANTYIAIKF